MTMREQNAIAAVTVWPAPRAGLFGRLIPLFSVKTGGNKERFERDQSCSKDADKVPKREILEASVREEDVANLPHSSTSTFLGVACV